MADELRAQFGLTQQQMAAWLGVPRASLALAERGHQALPPGTGVQWARLFFAGRGQRYHLNGTTEPAPPPLPPPPPLPGPLVARLDYCQHHAQRLQRELHQLQQQAARYEARLTAVPALRTGPLPLSAREDNWLLRFQQEAEDLLQTRCGAGPQRLLQARIAGLEHEAELLQELLTPGS